ncbi:SDR family NAD(P)-dependent oxidoreductase [Nonomuraea rhizosphaerae]|uniref:SDR family NAD(P)-dependent oxidoreductase n=1 Tax=Nonomuraea rhizosphaerae TaxID=2665663 RepID=UPI001FECDB0C|nr:SDR family NAD(P)-dependent oxidoreductase [Nonomuraea rhizosphaerae]
MRRSTDRSPALVVGGSRGIGYAVAEELASAGVALGVISYAREGNERAVASLAGFGPPVFGRSADVRHPVEFKNAVDELANELGGLRALVYSAGVHDRMEDLDDYDDALWERIVAVNLTGAFYAVRHAMPYLRRGAGSIVIIGSVASRRGFARAHGYVAAKHGLVGLTRSLAQELGPDEINVNLVCPGFVETDMTRDKAALRRWHEQNSPLGRGVEAAEVAKTVAFLLKDDVSAVTGQVIGVCGGTSW